MKRRTILVTLTEQQYEALAGAVATSESELADLAAEGDVGGRHAREAVVLDRAWRKINRAWHGAGRVGRSDSCP